MARGPAGAARAFAAMKRMEALKLPPNLYTYNSLISCCARAVLVAARTAEEQAPAPGDGPAERLEAAFGVFDDMVRRGLQPDNFTFSSLINACAKAQQAERALAEERANSGKAAVFSAVAGSVAALPAAIRGGSVHCP